MNVVIIVINKDDERIVDTLRALSELPEIQAQSARVAVIDASGGRFEEARKQHPAVQWVVFSPIPGTVTIAHQRNRGVAATTEPLVVFVDAACIPGPNWLQLLCAPIYSEGQMIVAGSTRSPDGRSLRDHVMTRAEGHDYLAEAPTINLAIKREVLDRLQGFDEEFAYGSDVDLSWRAVRAGYRIRYVPEAYVTHDWGASREEVRRSFMYGRGRARLFAKHPWRWRRLFNEDLPVLIYPILILTVPWFARRPWLLSLLAVPLVRNRGKKPLATLVEHFIYGAGVLRGASELRHAGRDRPSH
jgi:GT2 family glycosyltransferase